MSDVLYHYTDATGLKGIVDGVNRSTFPMVYQSTTHEHYSTYTFDSTLRLLATDVRFMNDTAELRHAGKIYADRMKEAAEGHAGLLTDLAEGLERAEYRPDPAQVFAVSFSTEGDDLSQWRGYAGGTGGFAIGISREVLANHTYPLFNFPEPISAMLGYPPAVELVKVSYQPDDIAAAAEKFIDAVRRSEERPSALPWLRFSLAQELSSFKSPAFQGEKEWRAFSHTMPPETSATPLYGEIKAGRYGLAPFTSFAVNMGTGWKPAADAAIVDLVVGPGPHQSLQEIAARQLLNSNGHNADIVRPSGVTFRG
jgi:hypothetical protein